MKAPFIGAFIINNYMKAFRTFLTEYRVSYPAKYENFKTGETKEFKTEDDAQRFFNNSIPAHEVNDWHYMSTGRQIAQKTSKLSDAIISKFLQSASGPTRDLMTHLMRYSFGDGIITDQAVDSIHSLTDFDRAIKFNEGMLIMYIRMRDKAVSEKAKANIKKQIEITQANIKKLKQGKKRYSDKGII